MFDLNDIPITDRRMCLESSFVLNNNILCYVRGVNNEGIHLTEVASQDRVVVTHEDIASIAIITGSIGYANSPLGAGYVSRMPSRQTRLSISRRNIDVRVPRKIDQNLREVIESVVSEGLGQHMNNLMTLNSYPTILSAYDNAKANNTLFAFSKNFAVDYEGIVYYRGKETGVYNGGVIDFKDKEHIYRGLL